MIFIVCFVATLVVGAVAIFHWKKQLAKYKEIAGRLSRKHGAKFTFRAESDVPGYVTIQCLAEIDGITEFPEGIQGLGNSFNVSDILHGTVDGVEVMICGLSSASQPNHYTIKGTGSWRVETVACFKSPAFLFPAFQLRSNQLPRRHKGYRERRVWKSKGIDGIMKGYRKVRFGPAQRPRDIDVYLGEQDIAGVKGFFTESVLDLLEAVAAEGIDIDAGGRMIAIYNPWRELKPDDIEAFFEKSIGIFQALTNSNIVADRE